MSDTPNRGIPYVPEGTLDPAAGLNLSLNVIDALLQTAVLSMALTAPPGGEDDGDLYIVAAGGTGAWAGLDNHLVRYVAEGTFWQSYEPGTQVALIINRADGNLYKWLEGSPGAWTLAAGLSDAPIDGTLYGRKDGTWEPAGGVIDVVDEDSPPTVSVEALALLIIGSGLTLTEPSAGVAHLEAAAAPPAPVVAESGANLDATPANAGNYTRFSNVAGTYTFDDAEAFVVGAEYHGRYVGAGTLTITAAGTMTVNAPADGTLVIPPGGTFTVKIVAADEADLFGVTVPA